MESQNDQPAEVSGGLAGFLEPNPISGGIGKDLAIIERAIREGWDVPADVRTLAVDRMKKILGRDSVSIPCGDGGTFDSVYMADRNAIGATAQLRGMTGENQAERHHSDKLAQDDKHLALGVAELAAKISDADFIALAKKHQRLDLLPPALRAIAGG